MNHEKVALIFGGARGIGAAQSISSTDLPATG